MAGFSNKIVFANLLFITLQVQTWADEPLTFTIERSVAHQGFDGKMCWVHARAGAIPAEALGEDATNPLVVITMQKLLLTGSDVFYALNETRSTDMGQTWTEPTPQSAFQRQILREGTDQLPTGASIAPQLLQPGDETTVCDFSPQWHAGSQRLLGIGQTVWYRDKHVLRKRPRGIAYAVYDQGKNSWGSWKTVQLPDTPEFQNAGSGSQQRVDLPGGDVLIPFYFKKPEDQQFSTAVCRCRFDGKTLHYVERGNSLTVPVKRGLAEPSLTFFGGRFYMTLRNDEKGYVSVSDDGLHYELQRPWTFDDGTELGSYNTQQHWVTHQDGLYLIYTRRGADNDHVFRHRAPLFMAQVDPEKLNVIRETERVLVPERGARLGNFGVVDVSPNETWVTAAEWMQPVGVEKYGSNNSIHIAKIKWSKPNTNQVSLSAEQTIAPYFEPPSDWKDEFGKFKSPLVFTDATEVKTPNDWQRRRAELLNEWEELLGKWPPLLTDQKLEVIDSQPREGFTQSRVSFNWTPNETTNGYLLVPDGDGPFPAVITVFYEPETALGQGRAYRDFAIQLAKRGFITLSIGTTEASEARTYALYYPSIEDAQVQPLSMLGCAAANAWHVLANHPQVDSKRIGIVGHSFGGKWAMFASCLFDKFACAAWSDPGIVFDEARPSVNYWEPWYLGYHPKPWRPRGIITKDNPARGLYPQLTAQEKNLHELHVLMAPRPFLVSGGSEDPISRWAALNHSLQVNEILGHENRVAMTNRPDHSPNADSNSVIYAFFEHFLQSE